MPAKLCRRQIKEENLLKSCRATICWLVKRFFANWEEKCKYDIVIDFKFGGHYTPSREQHLLLWLRGVPWILWRLVMSLDLILFRVCLYNMQCRCETSSSHFSLWFCCLCDSKLKGRQNVPGQFGAFTFSPLHFLKCVTVMWLKPIEINPSE